MKYKPFANIKEILEDKFTKEFNKEPYHTGLEPEEGEINHD